MTETAPRRRRKTFPTLLSFPLRVGLFCIGLAVTFLPRRAELVLGAVLGRLLLALGVLKSKIAEDNLRNCFPELSDPARRRLLERNFEHYGMLFFEYAHFFSPFPGHYRTYMERNTAIEGLENWRRAAAKGNGVVFVAAHMGYWEFLAARGALSGIPLTVVTTVVEPPWLHEALTAARLSTGVRATFHPGSMSGVLKALMRKESVAFMNDQYARPPMGMPVRFFGVSVDTLAAVGPIAKRTGAAIVPAYSLRGKDGKGTIRIEPELELGPALDDPAAATQAIAARVEAWVRQTPEQWLWMHRRFKNVVWPERG
ncbi:MAG: hypothetical protein HYZ75_02305 [Elusimicrobia bacterium]|nr:hypothetical protein [Elusimicrobiota bacterium]